MQFRHWQHVFLATSQSLAEKHRGYYWSFLISHREPESDTQHDLSLNLFKHIPLLLLFGELYYFLHKL